MRSSTGRALVIAAAALLQGCAGGVISMTPATRAEMKESLVVHTVRYRSEPIVGMSSAGEFEAAHGIADPADEISRRLAATLWNEGRMGNVQLEPSVFPRPVPPDVSYYQARYQRGMVLELIVESQGATQVTDDPNIFTYGLRARGRLIRLADRRVLWLDRCELRPRDDDGGRRSLDFYGIEASKGSGLRDVLSYSNERCARILAAKILGSSR